MQDIEVILKELVIKVLEFIGVSANVDVVKTTAPISSENGLEEDTYFINLEGDDLGVVIGYHGDTLAALQTILGLSLSKQLGRWVPLVVDVNNYRKDREAKLKDMARNAVDKVRFTLREVELPAMVSYERRLIHMEISKYDGVKSESIGEGYNRRVVVHPA